MKCPFFYWKKHKYQFPSVRFLARIFFKILTNHIEIEHIFTNASVLIILRHYQLRFDNLDVLVTIFKTLPMMYAQIVLSLRKMCCPLNMRRSCGNKIILKMVKSFTHVIAFKFIVISTITLKSPWKRLLFQSCNS